MRTIGFVSRLHSGISCVHSPFSWHTLVTRLQFPGQIYVATSPKVVPEKLAFPGNPEILGAPQSMAVRKFDQEVLPRGYIASVMCT